MIKQNTTFSIQIQKQKQLFVKVALIMHLNQSTLKNYTIQKKGLINIQNIYDNKCFKWSLVRYLNATDSNQARIAKADKYFTKKIDF